MIMKDELDAIDPAETPAGKKAAPRPAGAPPRKGSGHTEKTAEAPRSSPSPRPSRIPAEDDDDEENEGFFQRHGIKIIIAVAVLAIGGWIAFSKPSKPSAPARRPEPPMIMIKPVPAPTPPPTPPPKVIPPKEEVKREDKVSIPEEKPMEKPAPPKPVEKPPEGLGTNVKGPGGSSGLIAGGGNGVLGGTGTGPGGGSAGAWYAGQVKTKVAEALRNHRKTRNAPKSQIRFVVSINGSGQVTNVKLLGSTGDVSIDEAIKNEALNGIRLQDPPPGGKPMTVTLDFNASRPR
jgi:protein TonB